jgi:hypothetical protein
MSQRATDFLRKWLLANAGKADYRDAGRAQELAARCAADAEAAGLGVEELRQTVGGDLASHIHGELIAAVDREAERLAQRIW